MKKSIFSLVALLLALALPRTARAAGPSIKLELDGELRISATLLDPGQPADKGFRGCLVESQIGKVWLFPKAGDKGFEIGRVRVGNNPAIDGPEGFIVNLLAPGASVGCYRDKVSATDTVVTMVDVVIDPLTLKANVKEIQSSVAALSPGVDWLVFGPRFRDAMLDTLGTPTTCSVVPESQVARCVVGPIDNVTGTLRLNVTEAPDMQSMKLTFSKSSSVTVKLNVAKCTYRAAGPLPYIFAGASRQTLSLASDRPECQTRLDRLTSLDANGFRAIPVGSRPSSRLDVGTGKEIELSSIPASLPTGELTFTLRANGDAIGTAVVPVLESLSAAVSPKVNVRYDLPGVANFPKEFSARANDGVAVVTPKGADGKDKILNTVSILINPPLPAPSRPIDVKRDGVEEWNENEFQVVATPGASLSGPVAPEEVREQQQKVERSRPELRERSSSWVWRIRPTKGAPVFEGCTSPSSACDLTDGPGAIVFSLKDDSEGPIEAAVELVEVVQGTITTPDNKKEERRYRERQIFETTVTLAASARFESLPLPIRDRIYVDCRGANTNIMNSEMRAIDDEDVVNGTCSLVLLPVPIGKPGPSRELSLSMVPASTLDRRKLVECEQDRASYKACQANPANSAAKCEVQWREAVGCVQRHEADASSETWRTSIDQWIKFHPGSDTTHRLNLFYGSQRLIVVVKRDGTDIATKRWIVDPDQPTLLELPHGADADRGSLYSVEVRVAARPEADVFYATAKVDNGNTDDVDIPQTELRFSAQLRSRGQFGIKPAWGRNDSFTGFRAYATIPVQLAGFRFPAATSELRASSDPVLLQYMTPRTGLLGVVEPWSYDIGQNPWPLNPALAGGILAFDLAKPRVHVSTLLGIQVQAPLLKPDSSQLTSSIALGLFWEHGIEEKENSVLLTFGANVLSLFAGK